MNFKTSILEHPTSQVQLPTPLLIPSFSSRGFRGSGQKSEVRRLIKETAHLGSEVYLLSAYDIAKGHIPRPAELESRPGLIVLDSGGYEAIGVLDSLPDGADDFWPPEEHRAILESWPDEQPAIFVSYDHPRRFQSLEDQILEARKLKTDFGKHLHCFLIKPESELVNGSLRPVLSHVLAQADKLRGFDVIGVTDKGLGNSVMERMVQITRLRRALNEAKCLAPIHVFGSLDPLSVCLYYLAGAEIFDGLTWLRYYFTPGSCVYPNCHSPIADGLNVKDDTNRRQRLALNHSEIEKLQERLRFFARTGDFKLLSPHTDILVEAYADLNSRFST